MRGMVYPLAVRLFWLTQLALLAPYPLKLVEAFKSTLEEVVQAI